MEKQPMKTEPIPVPVKNEDTFTYCAGCNRQIDVNVVGPNKPYYVEGIGYFCESCAIEH
jgi:hypothetical protein